MGNKWALILYALLMECTSGILSGQFPATTDYKLNLEINYHAEKLYGHCEITLFNRSDNPFDTIPLLLYRLMAVKNVTNETGDQLSYTQKVVSIDGREKIQVNFIEVMPERNVLPGEKIKIILDYEGYMLGYSNEGIRYVKDHISKEFTIIRPDAYCYPVVGYPDTRDMMAIIKESYNYEVFVTIPYGLRAVSGAKLTGTERSQGNNVYSFQSKKPSWRLDVAIADYLVFENNKNSICCFREDSTAAKKILGTLVKTLELYSEWFGPLEDDPGYTIIEVPEGYSSQADAASFCITADNFKKNNGLHTIYHEISHLWNPKSLEKQPCRVESEGLARFLEILVTQKIENNETAVNDAAQWYLKSVRKKFIENPEFQNIPVCDYGLKNMTDYSYTLGMVIFALMYDLAGEENFNKVIRTYYTTYHQKGATVNDFVNCCKKIFTFNSDRFFKDWIFTTAGIDQVISGKSYKELLEYYGNI